MKINKNPIYETIIKNMSKHNTSIWYAIYEEDKDICEEKDEYITFNNEKYVDIINVNKPKWKKIKKTKIKVSL